MTPDTETRRILQAALIVLAVVLVTLAVIVPAAWELIWPQDVATEPYDNDSYTDP